VSSRWLKTRDNQGLGRLSVRGMIGESEWATIESSMKSMKRLRLSRSCGSAIAERHIGRKSASSPAPLNSGVSRTIQPGSSALCLLQPVVCPMSSVFCPPSALFFAFPSGSRLLYAVFSFRSFPCLSTKALNQDVKRNAARFPADFMFQINGEEAESLMRSRSRFVTLKRGYRDPSLLSGLL
jgi:hypothetical protein